MKETDQDNRPSSFIRIPRSTIRNGFTLLEVLVAIAVIAILMAVFLPSIARAKASARALVGLHNMRQIVSISAEYGVENRDRSPALGQPWTEWPFWAVVVQNRDAARDTGSVYEGSSVLRDPSCSAFYGRDMERCYAANATGHAGLPGDLDNFDVDEAVIRLDRVRNPSEGVWYVSSAVATATTNGPPPTRTAGALDLRQQAHVDQRLGRFVGRGRFLSAAFDGSASASAEIPAAWLEPLP